MRNPIPNGPEQNGRRRPFAMSTGSWVAIIVGLIMLVSGVIFDIDARAQSDAYRRLADLVAANTTAITGLLQTTVINATNIGNMTAEYHQVRNMVEDHIIKDGNR